MTGAGATLAASLRDRWLTWPETDICIILQLPAERAFSRFSEPGTSYTVATIGSICRTTEMCQPLVMHSAFAGANPSPLSFPFTVALLLPF